MYDRTQSWFYNIQVDDHIDYPNFWGSESGADPDLPVYEAWSDGMLDAIDIGLANYRYYIAAGTDHTIIFSNKDLHRNIGRHLLRRMGQQPDQRCEHAGQHGLHLLRRAVLNATPSVKARMLILAFTGFDDPPRISPLHPRPHHANVTSRYRSHEKNTP